MLRFRRDGSGPPLILVHGFMGGAGVWANQQAGLKDRFDTVAVDLPGFAGSPIGRAPTTMQGFAAEIIELADALGFARFSIAGWSFGGMIAQQVALDRPERVDRLVLAGTAAAGELRQRFETWAQTRSRIAAEGVSATLERTIRTWFVAGEFHPFFPACREACLGVTEPACFGAIDAIRPWTAVDRLADIRQPTLVVVGDRDRSTPLDESMVLRNGIPDVRLSVLPACAHGLHMEKPDLFNGVVADFLCASPR